VNDATAVRLMNTIWADRDGVHDALQDADELAAWLRAAGLDVGRARISGSDVGRARRLRDACRRVAAHITADPGPSTASATASLTAAVGDLNAVAAIRPAIARLVVRQGGLERAPTPPGQAMASALSAVAADAIDLFTNPDRSPVQACLAPGCVLYFVKDHPRRTWCSSACGNRARAARHYRRHHLE
jgi:predicted RNA-binding Zn ribbon-like protein